MEGVPSCREAEGDTETLDVIQYLALKPYFSDLLYQKMDFGPSSVPFAK